MNARVVGSWILVIIGTLAMLIGVLDPLEGSLIILPGSIMLALGACLAKTCSRKEVYTAGLLVAAGVGILFGLSACGGFGGRAPILHSNAWGLLLLPYPIGWLIGLHGSFRTLSDLKKGRYGLVENNNIESGHTDAQSAITTCLFGAVLAACLASACAPATPPLSPEQQSRLTALQSKAPNASVTILPVRVGGMPFDRATEFIGMQLEQKGLKNLELGKTPFTPRANSDVNQVAASLGEFIATNRVSTEYVVYGECIGNGAVNELRAIVADKTGAIVCATSLTPQSASWRKMGGDGDLLVACTVLAEYTAQQLGLNEAMAKAAIPGKMTAIMAERSGLPPESETAAIPGRQQAMKKAIPSATLLVYTPRARAADGPAEAGNAASLAKLISDAGLCKATPAPQPLVLTAPQADPNEMKVMWDLAREFREYVRKNPVDADYVLYADYRFNPQIWEAGFVHCIVCDRNGDWVIADLRNSHHDDYQSVKPTSREDCDKILVKILTGYLR